MRMIEEVEKWKFVKFGLIVTGDTERAHLPELFSSIMQMGNCTFKVLSQIGQFTPITSEKRKLKMVGSNKELPSKDETITIEVSRYLKADESNRVILIDDLENRRREIIGQTFARYRNAVDQALTEDQKSRVSVHFLVNMIEAYYFADANAINSALSTNFSDHNGDVEEIPNPKNKLKQAYPGFKEIEHGGKILKHINLENVLSNPKNCASLRTLVAWCYQALEITRTEKYQLLEGKLFLTTKAQLIE
jgi:Domain of unknown function (DUF4276)